MLSCEIAVHTLEHNLSTISDAGTSASLDAPATGNASATEVVKEVILDYLMQEHLPLITTQHHKYQTLVLR